MMPNELSNWDDLSDEAKKLLEKMLPEYKQRLDDIKRIPVSILIWGPTPAAISPVADIRRTLRTMLRNEGHLAMFSEEICDANSDCSVRLQQLVQAEQYDLIISIPESYGSIGEIHDFAADPRINSKIIIFLNEKHSSGYSTSSLESISCVFSSQLVMYNDDSINQIYSYSLNTVNKIREYKYLVVGRC